MNTDRALETDIDLEQEDAEGVKGGGIVDASASVDGVGSATVSDTNVTANALGTSAATSTRGSGWSANAKAGSNRAGAGGRKPRMRRRRPLGK